MRASRYGFWTLLACVALVPDRMIPRFEWMGLHHDLWPWLAVILGLIGLPSVLRAVGTSKRSGGATPSFRIVAMLLLYMMISLSWSDIDSIDCWAMAVVALQMLGTLVVCQAVVLGTPEESRGKLAASVALFVAAVSFIYFAESYFSLGLRTDKFSGVDPVFGLTQVKGPMFVSSTGYFILVPTAAMLIEAATRRTRHMWVWFAGVLAVGLALAGSGSRGALLTGLIAGGLVLLSLRNPRTALLAAAIGLVAIGSSAAIVFQRASAERMVSFEDPSRERHHDAAIQFANDRPAWQNLVGSGLGSRWPWYRIDYFVRQEKGYLQVRAGDALVSGLQFQYHPHSVLLYLAIEGGLVALTLLVIFVSHMVKYYFAGAARQSNAILSAAMLASSIGFLFDLFLFFHPVKFVVWWTYLFLLEASFYSSRRHPGAPSLFGNSNLFVAPTPSPIVPGIPYPGSHLQR